LIDGDTQIQQLVEELQASVKASLSANFSSDLPASVETGDTIYIKVSWCNVKLILSKL